MISKNIKELILTDIVLDTGKWIPEAEMYVITINSENIKSVYCDPDDLAIWIERPWGERVWIKDLSVEEERGIIEEALHKIHVTPYVGFHTKLKAPTQYGEIVKDTIEKGVFFTLN